MKSQKERPRLLDLFCGAGGAGKGYHDAGFDVVGVDINPQPSYPYEFIRGDAIGYVLRHGSSFDAIHCSPPCQRYTTLSGLYPDRDYPDLIDETRDAVIGTGLPYVIENVPGAPLITPILLCGTMFDGLRVYRHRLFETSFPVMQPPHPPHLHRASGTKGGGQEYRMSAPIITVTGHSYRLKDGREAMGIDWMKTAGLSQAIPPAYTRYIGEQLLKVMARHPADGACDESQKGEQ